jgi:nicotinate-nucleotide adenylyltransferase
MHRRIGIFGGSFDPPTLAHELVGEIFLQEFNLDEIRYVPARQNPLKVMQTWASASARWDMIQLMIEGHNGYSASNLEISPPLIYSDGDYVEDLSEDEPSYAYNTLHAFKLTEPRSDFIFLGGSDILRDFYKWHKAEEIIEEFHLGIAIRPPHSHTSTISPIRDEHRKHVTIVSRKNMPNISSTDVRSFLERGLVDDARLLLKPSIFEYIMDNHLYKKNPQTQ